MGRDFFKQKAAEYEQNTARVKNVDNIAQAVLNNVDWQSAKHIMDFGSGTGLLLERIAPKVEKITAVDISSSMNAQLMRKRATLPCVLEIIEMDLSKQSLDLEFDGIISSMTMHHIKDVTAMLQKMHRLLKENGFIALADLDKEDGSFHTEDTGVFHFGFEREWIYTQAQNVGFRDIKIVDASVAVKPNGTFPVFLLTAKK